MAHMCVCVRARASIPNIKVQKFLSPKFASFNTSQHLALHRPHLTPVVHTFLTQIQYNTMFSI